MSARPGISKTRSAAALQAVQKNIGHDFSDPALLTTALTHVSALKAGHRRSASYQRLEFLGDRVLGLAVSAMLFRAFPDADEGELSRRLADLVRKETCAEIAREIGLFDVIKLGAVGGGAGERLRNSILGDVCEAMIGAVFVDAGFEVASQMIERLWNERMQRPVRPPRDPKTVLQEWAQGRGLPAPRYREIERSGPHHSPTFSISVELPGLDAAQGSGPSKQSAEKAAAAAMLSREGVPGFLIDA